MDWNEHSDNSLIAYAASHLQHQGPAAMEMQRRLLDAIREFNTASNRHAATMIRLHRAMTTLTVALLVVGAIQLWAMVRLSGATTGSQESLKDATAQIGQSLSPKAADSLGWTIESYEQGVITVRHQGSTYKATCNVSRSFNNAPSVIDSKNVVEFPTCELPLDLVRHVVQPFLGQQRPSTGRIVSMWSVGSILAIQQSRNDNTPLRIDEFIITSVAKSH